MTVARRVFTIQLDVEAPITIGGREICDVVEKVMGNGVNVTMTDANANNGKLAKIKDWDFGDPKVIDMKMAEEPTQIDTEFGPVFIKEG